MEGLTLEGIVGLSVVEDSFITQNYYFNFTRETINTNVSQQLFLNLFDLCVLIN